MHPEKIPQRRLLTLSGTILMTLVVLVAFAASSLGGEGHGDEADHDGEPTSDAATLESDAVVSPDLYNADNWSYTFARTGLMEYHCHPHPWMLGSVEVIANDGRAPENHTVRIIEPVDSGPGEWTFEPAKLTVMVGDTVTWVNEGEAMHKVREMTEDHQHGAGGSHEAGDPMTDDLSHDTVSTADDSAGRSHPEAMGGSDFPTYLVTFLVGLAVGAVSVAAVIKP